MRLYYNHNRQTVKCINLNFILSIRRSPPLSAVAASLVSPATITGRRQGRRRRCPPRACSSSFERFRLVNPVFYDIIGPYLTQKGEEPWPKTKTRARKKATSRNFPLKTRKKRKRKSSRKDPPFS